MTEVAKGVDLEEQTLFRTVFWDASWKARRSLWQTFHHDVTGEGLVSH